MTPRVFRGWLKTSLIDYPGRVCSVLFTGGCNLRCPYCHNPHLVLRPDGLPEERAETVLAWLQARSPLVPALVVSGGEPTLQRWLGGFLRDAHERGLATGLQTNGTFPERLEALLDAGALDFVAMDVKSVLEPLEYARASGTGDLAVAERVRHSVELLMRSGVRYELRCTVVPGLHTAQTLLALARQLAGARLLVYQQFDPSAPLDPAYRAVRPFPPEELERMRAAAESFVQECRTRAPAPQGAVAAPPAPGSGELTAKPPGGFAAQTARNVVHSAPMQGGSDGVPTS